MRTKNSSPSIKMLPAPSLLQSGVKIGALSLWLKFKRSASTTHLLAICAVAYLVLTAAFTTSFFWPRSVNFSFADNNCFSNPTLLPNLVSKDQGRTFTATPVKSFTIAGYPLYSHTTCVTPTQAPTEKMSESISLSPLRIGFLKKSIRVSAGASPSLDYATALSQPVATKDPLVFTLDTPDRVFDYRLLVGDKKVDCSTSQGTVTCDVSKLGLDQSTNYTFVMQRLFDGTKDKTLFEQTATTVGAVVLETASITAHQTVYDVPAQMTLTVNKEIRSFSGTQLNLITDTARQRVPITTTASGRVITVRFNEPLARSSSFELSIQAVTAPDGGHLPAPLVLPFATSGGPKVKGVSIGSYKVSTTGNIVLTFDSAVSANQNLGDLIKLDMGGVSTKVSAKGNTVTISPTATLPKCTNFTVRVVDGLKNDAGISGGSAWSYKSRTICQSVFSIGTSVQGRSITAYRFGNGSSYVVFAGGTHGDERSSVSTLNSFIDYVERNYDAIPANRTIVIIPNINPDGSAKSTRTNAHNVDLNRNFPANNWKQSVTMPGGSLNPNGGGSSPLSEPESSAIANYILSVNPRLVLTYHAAAGVVMPNDAGDSIALAKIYDQKSNLGYEPSSQTGTIFAYDTTGSMEEWLYDDHGIPTLLIELWTKTNNEFSKNQNAMWHMATLQ